MFYVLCFIYVDIHPVHYVILRLSEPSFSSYLLKNVSVTQNAVSFSQIHVELWYLEYQYIEYSLCFEVICKSQKLILYIK